jgi:hypothetical protein
MGIMRFFLKKRVKVDYSEEMLVCLPFGREWKRFGKYGLG